jgi:hypothetical protein
MPGRGHGHCIFAVHNLADEGSYFNCSVCRLGDLLQTTAYKPLISLGVAAVGGTATMGVSALDAQRLKIIVSGQGPATNLLAPIPQPGTSFSAMAALDQAAAAAMMPSDLGLLGAGAMGFAM